MFLRHLRIFTPPHANNLFLCVSMTLFCEGMILQNKKMKTKFIARSLGSRHITGTLRYQSMICHAFNIATKLKQSRLRFLISNSAASLHDVDDGQTDDPANILEDTDSDKELEKERQE